MTTNHIQTFNSKFLSVVNSYNYYLYFLIIPGFEDNFNKQEGEYISTQGEAYDFGSVMHYRASAFAEVRGSPTIIPLPEHNIPLDSLGQRTGFSETDIVHAIKLNCPDTLTYG